MKFQKGFTLIELLVVVAIISLLSSVVLASIRDARNKAKLAAFQEEVEQFILATELYKSDHGGTLPAETFLSSTEDNIQPGSAFINNFGQYLPKFPTPPFNEEYGGGGGLYYDGQNGPFTCNGVESSFALGLVTYNPQYDLDKLAAWGWNLDGNSYYNFPCIAL